MVRVRQHRRRGTNGVKAHTRCLVTNRQVIRKTLDQYGLQDVRLDFWAFQDRLFAARPGLFKLEVNTDFLKVLTPEETKIISLHEVAHFLLSYGNIPKFRKFLPKGFDKIKIKEEYAYEEGGHGMMFYFLEKRLMKDNRISDAQYNGALAKTERYGGNI